jgi:hypothetical protein
VALALAGCPQDGPALKVVDAARGGERVTAEKRVFAPSRAGCEAVAVFAGGEAAGAVCVEDAASEGLTIVDLSDGWTPRIFARSAAAKAAPAYRAQYLKLAAQANVDLGLHGVAPNLTVVAARLADDARHTCDAAVDLAPIARADASKKVQPKETVAAIQAELVCAGWLERRQVTGRLGGATQRALELFRRRNMIVGSGVDADTLRALALGGEELAFRALLRGLRDRVADGAGLLEDGSALEERETVVDRELDLSRFAPQVAEALPNGAPDLVSQATDRAARALGWTSPEAARAFVQAQGGGLAALRVAVALPRPPAYHSQAMELRVEIDRGDVFYDTPGAAAAARKKLGTVRVPTFVVYAKDGDREVALVRWATTIGGWKKERLDEGEIALKYKASDVGDRVWRQLIAAPAWLPPDSTPETDLVHEGKDGTLTLKRDLIQPGYRNAYGLVMLIHDEPVVRGGETTWIDRGIRTHGSVDYRSIKNGTSHGCHRLYNQLVLRLSGFLLQHRANVPRGKMSAGYQRTVEWNDQTVEIDVPTRGYLYELDPPVPVRVLEGNIAGDALEPVSLIRLEPEAPKGSS